MKGFIYIHENKNKIETLNPISWIYVYTLMPALTLSYRCFMVNFEIRSVSPLTLFPFFNVVLAILHPFHFHTRNSMNFRISLSISTKLKTILKEEKKIGGLTLSDFQTYSKAIVNQDRHKLRQCKLVEQNCEFVSKALHLLSDFLQRC